MKETNRRYRPPDRVRLMAQEIERVFERICVKAGENCVSRGYVWGYQIGDWLLAERALLRKPEVRIGIDGIALTLEIDLPPGPTPELKTHATEDQVLITSEPDSDGRQIFRLVALPERIDSSTLSAEIAEGHLRISVQIDRLRPQSKNGANDRHQYPANAP